MSLFLYHRPLLISIGVSCIVTNFIHETDYGIRVIYIRLSVTVFLVYGLTFHYTLNTTCDSVVDVCQIVEDATQLVREETEVLISVLKITLELLITVVGLTSYLMVLFGP